MGGQKGMEWIGGKHGGNEKCRPIKERGRK